MKKEARAHMADSLRPWVSLAITIHFFAIVVSLSANLSPSELQRRLRKMLAPYTVTLHQDYQGVPLEMTRGSEIDYPCAFEIRRAAAEADQWQTVEPPKHFASALDHRWRTFQRMTNITAIEQNEELVQLLFEQCVRREEAMSAEPIHAVRLVRRASLSYASDQAYVAGELPKAESDDRTLFECRVVKLEGDRIKLIPVLESLRTSKSLTKADAAAENSEAAAAAKDAEKDFPGDQRQDQSSPEVQP